MTLDALIEILAVRAPTLAEVEDLAGSLKLSVSELCDEVFRTIALRFVEGRLSFELADGMVNTLFGFSQADDGLGVTDFGWDVYLAFDAGEFEHSGEPAELQGEALTRRLLSGIAPLGLPPAPPEDPAWRVEHEKSARAKAVSVAKQVLDGQLSPMLGAMELRRLRPSLNVPSMDSDFDLFSAIGSEGRSLPIGPIREHWAPDALAAKAGEIRNFERWSREVGTASFRNVISRFGRNG